MQFGLSATANNPGFELAGTLTADSSKSGNASEGGAGFEALLAALVAGNANGQTKLNIDALELDGVTPETQEIMDALAGMAQTLVPLANAFDNLEIPTAEQLNQARDALAKLVESINNHPNRPELSLKGSVGSFAAQLSELRKAGGDVGKEGASDFAKVGNLLERVDKLLGQMTGDISSSSGQNSSDKASLNIHQMVDRLNQLAEKLPTLPAQFAAQSKNQTAFANSAFDAQAGQSNTQTQGGNAVAQSEQIRTAGGTSTNGLNVAADAQNQFELDPNRPVARNAQAQPTTNPTGAATDGTKPDILAQLSNLGQQPNPEMKKAGTTSTQAVVDQSTSGDAELAGTRLNFAQATREAHLQTANAYPEMQKAGQTSAATAPLSTELDAVETGTEKLLGQHKIETFNQQINHIDAAKAQTSGRQINMPGLAFEIVRQFRAGQQRFDVRLDPPEMGRIDVRMEVEGNNVTARLVVERAETLDFLQRDARALERALQQAGLNADRADLQFSLKQDGQGAGQNFDPQGHENETVKSADMNLPPDEQARLSETTVYRGTTAPGGLNLWV